MGALKQDLKELAGLSKAAAKHPGWAQAGGGNASLKRDADGLLLVKASGLRLDECTSQRGFVALDLAAVRAALDDPAYLGLGHAAQQDAAGEALAAALRPQAGLDQAGLRPSLEAELHALGPRACLHVHQVEAQAALCLEEAQQELDAVFGGLGLPWVWADYRPPGHSLACLVRDALRHRQAGIAALGNHGLVLWGPDAAHCVALGERLQQAFAAHFKAVQPPHLPAKANDREAALAAAAKAAREAWPQFKQVAAAQDPWAQSLAAGGAFTWVPICPDDMVYCGAAVPTMEARQAADPQRVKALVQASGSAAVLALRDHGVLIAARDERAWRGAHEMLAASARARALGRSKGHVRALDAGQIAEVLGMQGEQYRQGQA